MDITGTFNKFVKIVEKNKSSDLSTVFFLYIYFDELTTEQQSSSFIDM